MVIARISKQYDSATTGYWYGIKAIDLERIKLYGITKYAFVMIGTGTLVLPISSILEEISKNNFYSTYKNGNLIHYHMCIFVEGSRVFWKLKDQNVDVSGMVFRQ